jgi:hypothetical protein
VQATWLARRVLPVYLRVPAVEDVAFSARPVQQLVYCCSYKALGGKADTQGSCSRVCIKGMPQTCDMPNEQLSGIADEALSYCDA